MACRLFGKSREFKSLCTAIMPQPMSTPTAAGMIAPLVGITLPTVAPMPQCTSGIAATHLNTNGSCATFRSCCLACSSSGTPRTHALTGTPFSPFSTRYCASSLIAPLNPVLRVPNSLNKTVAARLCRCRALARPGHRHAFQGTLLPDGLDSSGLQTAIAGHKWKAQMEGRCSDDAVRHVGDEIARNTPERSGYLRIHRNYRESGILLTDLNGEPFESIGSDAPTLNQIDNFNEGDG